MAEVDQTTVLALLGLKTYELAVAGARIAELEARLAAAEARVTALAAEIDVLRTLMGDDVSGESR